MNNIRSPKQRKVSALQGGLKYYAAFSQEFVEDVIAFLNLNQKSTILDPWNGSGTTTEVASCLNFSVIGYDLNPAVKMLAQTRLACESHLSEAKKELANCIYSSAKTPIESDLPAFRYWLTPPSIHYLATLKSKIVLIEDNIVQSLASISIVNAIRRQLSNFKSKNPSWIRIAKQEHERIDLEIDKFESDSLIELDKFKMCYRQAGSPKKQRRVVIEMADAKKLPLANESIDAIITSPPYCTRIDYAVTTLVELAWLGIDTMQIQDLRSKLMGTPIVKKLTLSLLPLLPPSVDSLLLEIKKHPSKASAAYYFKTYFQFFTDMQVAFKELHRVIRSQGKLCLVVQDSHYKEISIPLSILFQDMLKLEGFELIDLQIFPAKGLNLIHGHKSVNEVALTCRKII